MSTLSRELALRVGLAARALAVSPRTLVTVLQTVIGLPFTADKFRRLEPQQLLQGAGQVLAKHSGLDLQRALHYLQGLSVAVLADADVAPLPATSCHAPPAAWTVRVAVASMHGQAIDSHFPGAGHLRIYRLNRHGAQLESWHPQPPDMAAALCFSLAGCALLLARGIDVATQALLVRAGVHPLQYPDPAAIDSELTRLRCLLGDAPPPWLAKAMGLPAGQRQRYQQCRDLAPPRVLLRLVHSRG